MFEMLDSLTGLYSLNQSQKYLTCGAHLRVHMQRSPIIKPLKKAFAVEQIGLPARNKPYRYIFTKPRNSGLLEHWSMILIA